MKFETRQTSDLRCAFCHDVLSESVRTCQGCQAVYHPDCLQTELGGTCGTRGCAGAPRVRAAPRLICCSSERPYDAILTCNGCGSLLHEGCVERLGGCCDAGIRRPAPPAAPTRPVVRREAFWTFDVSYVTKGAQEGQHRTLGIILGFAGAVLAVVFFVGSAISAGELAGPLGALICAGAPILLVTLGVFASYVSQNLE